ncbi:MAG: hypothetical protein COW12_08775 [Candidatus Omnitrophica bacterium CG12_big_fil_rev_8_21_14_0_65_45_16]|nr:MAG: hypothetical protein COW12_08775 [Candidatus Omnitrophica bacterium CG12_big_fil_rev_8_21_14_0_65_45_16]
MVAGIAILLLVGLVVVSVFLATQVIWQESLVNVKLQEQTMRPLQTMAKELKEAGPSSPIGITIGAEQTSIIFAIPDEVGSEEINSWKQIMFSFDDATGEITRTGDASSVIGRDVQSLTFSQAGNVITIALEVADETAGGKTLTTSLTSQIAMRN